MDLQNFYFGSTLQSPDIINIKCGPFTFFFQNGMIRSIMHGKTELIRRIYMALRDSVWNTIPYTISKPEIRQDENNFSLSFDANHLNDNIKFQWSGLIKCSDNGSLSFQMHGKALSTFERNRIGLCVLFPLSFSGNAVSIFDNKKGTISGVFPIQIAPHQPFTNISAIKGSAPDGTLYELTLEGDTFEMEDQRNWTDASYKVYSTPLNLPLPAIVNENDEICQSITLLIKPQEKTIVVGDTKEYLRLPQVKTSVSSLPLLGLMDTTFDSISPPAINYLNALNLNHCRYDLFLDGPSIISDLQIIAQRCSLFNSPIELALHCINPRTEMVEILMKTLIISGIRIYRFCIYDNNKVTSQETLAVVVPALKSHFPSSIIASGTDFYFVELNRNHPPLYLVDQVCYSANPQVHTFDPVSIMENLQGIEETLKHARTFSGEIPPIISPLTLRPRKNLKNPLKDGGIDVRQQGLFCSSWTAGVIMHAASAGAPSITLYDIFGEGGIIQIDGSVVYPAYIVLLWLSEFAGKPVILCPCKSSFIQGMIIHSATGGIMLIANYSEEIRSVIIEGLPDEFSSKVLDQFSFIAAVSNPIAWNSIRPEYHFCKDKCWETVLFPFAVLKLSF